MALYDSIKSLNTQSLEKTNLFKSLEKKFNEPKWYKPMLDYSEEASKLNRVYLVSGFSFMLFSSLFYQYGFQLICAAFGFLYPGYQTILSLENPNAQDTKRWLTYWLVLSAFNFAEILLFFLHWIPGFVLLKCAFFMWCFCSATAGSDIVYNFLICPFFRQNQHVIDDTISHLIQTAQQTMQPVPDPNLEGNSKGDHRD